jgi:TonB family protein
MYGTSAPTWDPSDKTFSFQVASPHFGLNGSLNTGYYSLILPKSLAECRWGKNISQAKIVVSVISSDGNSNVGTSSYSVKDNLLTFNISGFTFSSPTIKIGLAVAATPTPTASPTPTPTPKPKPTATPTPKPKPSPTPTPKPKPSATPSPKPSVSPKPKPSPSASPKASPKASPSASPKASPGASPKASPSSSPGAVAGEAKPSASPGDGKPASQGTGKPGASGGGGGTAASGTGRGGAGGTASEFAWYHELIHDRFFSQWEQPTSIFEQDKSFVCTVKIQIKRDGTIASAEIVRPSGNPLMDQSVLAALNRVSRIDALPTGLGTGDAYTININFELQ